MHSAVQEDLGRSFKEKADVEPEVMKELPPVSSQLQAKLGDDFEIVATIMCGDSYFNENIDEASEEILEMVKSVDPQLFIAGPAFNAGRYGVACGTITSVIQEKLNIAAVTGMYIENPGADMYKKELYIVETANSAAGMRKEI